jgi:tetratricopeptide (TPR) repeat protein
MSSHSSPPFKSYQQAADCLKWYGATIALLESQLHPPLSPSEVQEVLVVRDRAYAAVYRLCWIWLAEIIYSLGKVLVQVLQTLLSWVPRTIRQPGREVARRVGMLWFWVPKDRRVWVGSVQNWLGVRQGKLFVLHLTVLHRLDRCDRRFYAQAGRINQQCPLPSAVWEGLSYPPECDAFGFLAAPKALPWRDRLDPLWEFFSVIFLTAAIAILLNISTRLFSDGPDAKGIQEIIVPSLMTLLAGSGLTRNGREIVGRVFDAFHAPKHWRDEFIFLSIFLAFLAISNVWRQLPDIALQQTQAGHEAMCFVQPASTRGLPSWLQFGQTGQPDNSTPAKTCVPQLAKAESAYGLAIKLDVDNTEAHYGLGRVYEALQQSDAAIAQYQLAVKGDLRGISYKAYDRLARLFILKTKKDSKDDGSVKAIAISKDGLDRLLSPPPAERQPNDPSLFREIEYALYKNLGWAYLVGQDNLGEAKSYLEQAKGLIDDRAAAHCLLAQVYDQQADFSMVKNAWERCIGFARGADQTAFAQGIEREEEQWFSEGRERLTQLNYQESVKTAERQIANGRLDEAYQRLQTAIALLRNKAPAYCLMAQVDEKRQKSLVTKTHWELCAEYARLDPHDRETWLPIAKDRLTTLNRALSTRAPLTPPTGNSI